MAAETHSPEYLLHKYWARKPHNVVSAFIQKFVPEDGLVVDPCCGSGVALREAQKLGKASIGFDVNPIACLISSVLVSPPDQDEFLTTVQSILGKCREPISRAFSFRGRPIRYCVHEIVARCPQCKTPVERRDALQTGKGFSCPHCRAKLHFNLENMAGTTLSAVCMDDTGEMSGAPDLLARQTEASNARIFDDDTDAFDYPFAENHRILAFEGMTTRHLFTPRNFSVLAHLANEFRQIPDPGIRDAARLFLSASIAQCSRLIATRNNLSTGGPAWSIPGFWVPAVHMEANPLSPLRARLKKFAKGLAGLASETPRKPAIIRREDARTGLRRLAEAGTKADLVFFDPPYGDSVPYAEFSAMWNSFLCDVPNPATDISVSDRLAPEVAWSKYSTDMRELVDGIRRVMKPSSTLLVTFNNNDPRAWKALLDALQKASLSCDFVTYQIPAVVSSKAQKALEGSYVSDIYVGCKLADGPFCTRDISPVAAAVRRCAANRGGILPEALARREAMLAWLRHNVSADELYRFDEILDTLFERNESLLRLKEGPQNGPSPFCQSCKAVATRLLSTGPKEWKRLYASIAAELAECGIPDPHEVKAALNGLVRCEGNLCFAEQPSLF